MEDQIKAMKVTELKEALKAVGQSPLGKKDELVARLIDFHQNANANAHPHPPTSSSSSTNQPNQESLLKLDPMSIERMRMRKARFGCTSESLERAEKQEMLSKRSARFQ